MEIVALDYILLFKMTFSHCQIRALTK